MASERPRRVHPRVSQPSWLVGVLAFAALAACARAPHHQIHLLPVVASPILLPPGFAAPLTPADNPLTVAKVELGRALFYDARLSRNETQSCASCHQQRLAFTDGRRHAIGSTHEEHFRNTMGLGNAGYRRPLTWADPDMLTLEQQVLVPLTNVDPVEMGMKGQFPLLIERLHAEARYVPLFAAAFPGEADAISMTNVTRAIASFERTLISGNSPYDRLVHRDEAGALSADAWQGMRLFFSPRLGCASCHGGPDFGTPATLNRFENTGLYARASYPMRDRGLRNLSGRRVDTGKFRIPSLRNVAITAPYMHDGSAATLSDVIDDYAAGGRASRVGHGRRERGLAVRPFAITAHEKQQLIAFLETLTDEKFLHDPRFSDPWK